MSKITLTLTGYLGEVLPSFCVDAKTMRDAMSALSEKLRGLSRENYHQIMIEGFTTKNMLEMEIHEDLEVVVNPVFSGGSAVARIIVGILIIVVAFALQYLTAGASTPYTSYLVSAGLGMILGGALELFIKPQAVEPRNGSIAKVGDNLLLSNDQNTTKIGTRIPVIYGKRRWFGQIISVGVSTKFPKGGGGDGGGDFPFKTGDDYDGQSAIESTNTINNKRYKDAYVFKPLYSMDKLEGGKYASKTIDYQLFHKTPAWPDLSIVYFSRDRANPMNCRISTYGDKGELLQTKEFAGFNMTTEAGYNQWFRMKDWLLLNIGNAGGDFPYVTVFDLTNPDIGLQTFYVGGFEWGITSMGKLGATGDNRYLFMHPWLGYQGRYSSFYYRIDTVTREVKLFPVSSIAEHPNFAGEMGGHIMLSNSNLQYALYDKDLKKVLVIDSTSGFNDPPDRASFIQFFGTSGRIIRGTYHKTTFEPVIYTVCHLDFKTGKLTPELEYVKQDKNINLALGSSDKFATAPVYDKLIHKDLIGVLQKTKVLIK